MDYAHSAIALPDGSLVLQCTSGGDPQSLATLLLQLCDVRSDKSWQLSDWRVRYDGVSQSEA